MQSIRAFFSPVLWVFAFALALYATALPAQTTTGSHSGLLSTPAGEAFDDGVITVVSTRFRATSDADDAFSLPNLSIDSHNLEIESPSYDRSLERVDISAGETAKIDVIHRRPK